MHYALTKAEALAIIKAMQARNTKIDRTMSVEKRMATNERLAQEEILNNQTLEKLVGSALDVEFTDEEIRNIEKRLVKRQREIRQSLDRTRDANIGDALAAELKLLAGILRDLELIVDPETL